jgi:hypothetical protein
MGKRTFELMTNKLEQQASCSGATQIGAGVLRPEVIIPVDKGPQFQAPSHKSDMTEGGMKIGDTLRIIREPHFGAIARVKALPAELQQISTESHVRVLVATLPDGRDVTIPRANVEMIEE